jgi:transcriptional regulator NrdR family protein
MQCPKCNAQADCKDSREIVFTRKRRYYCNCGFRFSSIEIVVGVADMPKPEGNRFLVNRWLSELREAAFIDGEVAAKEKLRSALGL